MVMTFAPNNTAFFDLLNESHRRLLGRPLVQQNVSWLYHDAPFVVLAHDTAADPLFTYANRTAQTLFGYGWDEFLRLPSRLSAEPALQSARQSVFERVARDGFVTGYTGVRVTKDGRRFRIEDATIWRLTDEDGRSRGEAATFARWRWLEQDREAAPSAGEGGAG